ncbi:MAG: Maf family nucleotide pyrophosphatase [Akkermansiaceae bacterium]|nr:Maf family nucleotide pyrophosphatase [Akkermansiaceae bacterium]
MSLRVAIAGIHIESGTFSPLLATRGDFTATHGVELLARYPFLTDPEFAGIFPQPLVHFRALPGGCIRQQDYLVMKQEILDRLAQLPEPPEAFYFDVHGAMGVDGIDDAEADLLDAIRRALPPGILVTCSQDLHGNVSPALVARTDIITAYRTAPHVDWLETRARALRLLLRAHRTGLRPLRARVGIPVLVSGEMSTTTCEPGAALYAPLAAQSAREGVWEASLWVGYAWADQARAMATVVVTGDDAAAVGRTAAEIARRYWEARRDFRFAVEACAIDDGIARGLAAGVKPVFLSDAGDNPTAGGAGDVTAVAAAMLENPALRDGRATAIYASLPDAPAIERLRLAKLGDRLTLSLGGKLDPVHGAPLEVTGTLVSFHEGDNPQAVLRCGGVCLIITARRRPYHLRADFLALGLDPLEHDLCVVKIGYLEPELAAMARHHLLLLSPGAVPPVLTGIPYKNLQRPIFPLDRDFEWEPQVEWFPAPCVVLASGSPRRRELLAAAGLVFDILVSPAEEVHDAALDPAHLCEENARLKAAAVAATHPHATVIGADTLVFIDDLPLGKPTDLAEAHTMLRRLSGRVHQVCTGVCVIHPGGGVTTRHELTAVRFRPLDDAAIGEYLARVNPLDKAGAYGIQEHGDLIVESIDGAFDNVMGLPVALVLGMLRKSTTAQLRA